MKLIGMLDSPYVRRVAISLQLLGIEFEHHPISVFSQFEEFRRINPAVKAPTMVCEDGTVLTDSSIILEYVEAISAPRSLRPTDPARLAQDLAVLGMALVGCEKTVQVVYERNLRPAEKLHGPWVDRVFGQLRSAFSWLDLHIEQSGLSVEPDQIRQASVTAAVAWHFSRRMLPELLASEFPHLEAFSARAEELPEFQAAPHGPGTVCRTEQVQ